MLALRRIGLCTFRWQLYRLRIQFAMEIGYLNLVAPDGYDWLLLEDRFKRLCLWIQKQKVVDDLNAATWREMLRFHFEGRQENAGSTRTLIGTRAGESEIKQLRLESDNVRRADIGFPYSFERGDGACCCGTGYADDDDGAVEVACLALLMKLLLRDALENYPNNLVHLKTNNWAISIPCLQERIVRVVKMSYLVDLELYIDRGISGMDPSERPVRPRSLYQEPIDQDARDAEIMKLLTDIFVHVRGWQAYQHGPSLPRFRRYSDGRPSGIVGLRALASVAMPGGRVIVPWRALARLARPHTLLQFLRDRPDAFVLRTKIFGGTHRLHYFAWRSDVDGPGQPVALESLTGWGDLPTVGTLISELRHFSRAVFGAR